MIHIVLWKWDQPNGRHAYTPEHVDVMCAMLRRNITLPHRIICITDDDSGIHECETFRLWPDLGNVANATRAYLPSCYRRLKLYDRATQEDLRIAKGDRIVSIDLDTLILGNINNLLVTDGRFIGWEMKGTHHERVYNGSLQMFNAGDLQHIWSDFDPQQSPKQCFEAGFLGSDQSWLSMNLIGQPRSVGLGWPDVASYPLQARLHKKLSALTKIMFFHGSVKPWYPQARADTPWVGRYWRM